MSQSPNTKRGTGLHRSNDEWIVDLIWAMVKAAGYLLWLAIFFPAISVPALISLSTDPNLDPSPVLDVVRGRVDSVAAPADPRRTRRRTNAEGAHFQAPATVQLPGQTALLVVPAGGAVIDVAGHLTTSFS